MKSVILSELSTVLTANGMHELTVPFRFFSHRLNRIVEVPAGFPTDFASARIGNWQLLGHTERPAVAHDWLFATGEVGLILAGLVFYDLLRAEKETRWRSCLYALAATITPGARKAWKAHRRGTTPGARFVESLKP